MLFVYHMVVLLMHELNRVNKTEREYCIGYPYEHSSNSNIEKQYLLCIILCSFFLSQLCHEANAHMHSAYFVSYANIFFLRKTQLSFIMSFS